MKDSERMEKGSAAFPDEGQTFHLEIKVKLY